MIEIVYGTYNSAKYESMVDTLKDLNINIINLKSISYNLLEAEESGNSPLSNAEKKAMYYYSQIKIPVFSCDTGLYFKGVDKSEQPGVYVRRINGRRLNDEEMMKHYIHLAEKYGGKLTAYYKNAICVVLDSNNIIKYDGTDLHSEEFYIADKPHKRRRDGFPLDSISVDIESGKHYFDIIANKENKYTNNDGFLNFFERLIESI